jgi:hypothetical protein
MIVAANIGVADEVELIDRHIRHLQAIGVDRIVVTDTGSTDGTQDILHDYADRGDIVLLNAGSSDDEAFNFANRMLQHTLETLRPDWILFGDADEFHIPRTGRIHDALATANTDLLQVERYNVPVSANGPLWPVELGPQGHDALELIVRQVPDFHQYLPENPDTSWILGRIVPKVVARAAAVASGISTGAHAAHSPQGRPPTSAIPTDLLIAHLPITSRERFMHKLDNIRRLAQRLGDRYGPGTAWHWRRWVKLADEGRADEEFDRLVFDADQLAELRARGTVMSAAAWFANPVVAEAPR